MHQESVKTRAWSDADIMLTTFWLTAEDCHIRGMTFPEAKLINAVK